MNSLYFKSKKLKLFYVKNDPSKLPSHHINFIDDILEYLQLASSPSDMDRRGWDFHRLKGDRKDTYSVEVQGNWKITFEWGGSGPFDIDYEDFH